MKTISLSSILFFTRKKTFFILWCSSLISNLGSAISGFAVMWYVLEKTHSPIQMGLIAIVGATTSVLLGPFMGAIVDRSDSHRNILILTYLASALTLLTLAGLIHLDLLNIFGYCSLVFFQTIFYIPQKACCRIIIQNSLNDATIENGVAFWSLSNNAAVLFGPFLGGIILTLFGPSLALFLDALSFLIGAAILLKLQKKITNLKTESSPQNGYKMFKNSLRYLVSHKTLFYLMLFVSAVHLLVGALPITLLVFVKQDLAGTAKLYGGMETLFILGFMTATFFLGFIQLPQRRRDLLIFGILLLQTFSLYLIGSLKLVWITLLLLFIFGLAEALFNVIYESYVIRFVDTSQMGRFSSFMTMLNKISVPLSLLLCSYALKYFPASGVLQAMGGLAFVSSFLVLLIPGLSTIGNKTTHPTPQIKGECAKSN